MGRGRLTKISSAERKEWLGEDSTLVQIKSKKMIEPRSAPSTRRISFMIQSKTTGWIIRTLQKRLPGGKHNRGCPKGAEFFDWAAFLPNQNIHLLAIFAAFVVKRFFERAAQSGRQTHTGGRTGNQKGRDLNLSTF